jgi:hypothetical protein
MDPVTVRIAHSDKTWRLDESTLAGMAPASYSWTSQDQTERDPSSIIILSERIPRAEDVEVLLDRLQEGVA